MIVNGETINCKVMLLPCIADLPAKAAMLNVNQFNGEYGCSTGKHKGNVVSKTSK